MIKTDKKIYLYNRNRVIYTDNDKLYIRYKNEYLLLKTLNGGGTEEEKKIEDEEKKIKDEKQKKLKDEKQKKLEYEKQKKLEDDAKKKLENEEKKKLENEEKKKLENKEKKIEDENQKKLKDEKQEKLKDEKQKKLEYEKQKKLEDDAKKKLENEEKKRKGFRNILKHMLDNVVSKTNDYYSYINDLKSNLSFIINDKTDEPEDKQKKIKDILYDKFFMNYILEIIGYEDYYKYITFFIKIQEDDTIYIENIRDTIIKYKDIYASNFEDFKEFWNKEKDKMGKSEEIRKMIKEHIDIIDYTDNDLYKKEKYYDNYYYNKEDFENKFEYIKKNYNNLEKYVNFTIYFFNYIVYTSFKYEFDNIKKFVKTY
jgi:hypothetical protein